VIADISKIGVQKFTSIDNSILGNIETILRDVEHHRDSDSDSIISFSPAG
jgi:hypothetical protein